MAYGGNTVAIEWGGEPPVLAVIADPAGDPRGFTYFSVIWSDAPPEDAEREETSLACAHCLIEAFPAVGRGMDIALERGCAIRDPAPGSGRRASPATSPTRTCSWRAKSWGAWDL